ncbi:hypothetical protein GCM10023228_16510 [Brevibacillus fulvus]
MERMGILKEVADLAAEVQTLHRQLEQERGLREADQTVINHQAAYIQKLLKDKKTAFSKGWLVGAVVSSVAQLLGYMLGRLL